MPPASVSLKLTGYLIKSTGEENMKKTAVLLFIAALLASSDVSAKTPNTSSTVSFKPTTVAVAPLGAIPIGTVIAWPSTSNPSDAEKWLECDGRAVSSSAYPKLYALMHNTPNFKERFLRGIQSGHSLLETAEDTIKTHQSKIPSHTHTYDGGLVGTAISGVAGKQSFTVNNVSLKVSGTAKGQSFNFTNVTVPIKQASAAAISADKVFTATTSVNNLSIKNFTQYSTEGFLEGDVWGHISDTWVNSSTKSGSINVSIPIKIDSQKVSGTASGTFSGKGSTSTIENGKAEGTISGKASSNSSVSGTVKNTSVSGKALDSGELTASYTGGSETAPKHRYIRYLIRAAE